MKKCEEACLAIRQFNDLDADGRYDPGEPLLEGIAFDIVEGDDTHQRTTGVRGEAWICFREPTTVSVRELLRSAGGQWTITSRVPPTIDLPCGDTEIWIGNARITPPRTGEGGPSPARTPSGRFALM